MVGALRMMQGWNFASILVEVGLPTTTTTTMMMMMMSGVEADGTRKYRAHSGPTKHRYSDEQYIEARSPPSIIGEKKAQPDRLNSCLTQT